MYIQKSWDREEFTGLKRRGVLQVHDYAIEFVMVAGDRLTVPLPFEFVFNVNRPPYYKNGLPINIRKIKVKVNETQLLLSITDII